MPAALPSLAEVESAAKVVYASMPPTPQYAWPLINAEVNAEVWIKHENHTPTGAFKVRGGLVYFDWLKHERPGVAGVVSATRGNHGQSIGFAARKYGYQAAVVVPHGNSPEKNAAMRGFGVELIEHGSDFQDANEYADVLAAQRTFQRLHSFEPLLVRGVATYALEFFRSAPQLDSVYVPVGQGSGICGVIAMRDALHLNTKVIGVVSSHAPAYALSFAAQKLIAHPSSTALADGVACRLPTPGSLEVILRGAERIIEVTDDEVAAAIRLYFRATHNAAEGAGALGLAALIKDPARSPGATCGTVLCGGNIDSAVLRGVLTASN